MSTQAQEIFNAYQRLPKEDQLAVYEAIARSKIPAEYGEFTDEELTCIAAQSFAILDQDEESAKTR